jgi:siroheme decarboxylase
MDTVDMSLLIELQKGLPLVPEPYAAIGERLGLGEEEVLNRINSLKQNKVIRRFRARINQRSLGIVANALVGWNIPRSDEETGIRLASMPGVTHCYRRRVYPGRWEYAFYTVHHGWSREQILSEVAIIAQKTGYSEYVVLFSTDEYKRTPHVIVQDRVADQ